MNLGIHGTRDLYDDRIRLKILEVIEQKHVTKIVTHGEPHGVCEIARKLAQEIGMPLELHFLNIKNGRGMFANRSKEVIENSDYSLIFHDGKSKGTSNEKKMLDKFNKPYEYYVFEPSNDWSVDDFDLDNIEI